MLRIGAKLNGSTERVKLANACAAAFELSHHRRERGEGIKRIFGEMGSLGLADPIYTQGTGSVRLVLSSADPLPAEVRTSLRKGARHVLDVLRLAGKPLGTGQVAELAGLARPTASRHLRRCDLGLVIWDGQGPKAPRASWRLH